MSSSLARYLVDDFLETERETMRGLWDWVEYIEKMENSKEIPGYDTIIQIVEIVKVLLVHIHMKNLVHEKAVNNDVAIC